MGPGTAEIAELSMLSSQDRFGKLIRFPLKFVPRTMALPILRGPLRGTRWIVGSAIHRCWMGLYEPRKQRSLAREIRPNSVFWDVGANVGFYSLLAANLVGSGRVFAFEPVPRNLAYLRKHLALNRATNVEILEVAVSDRIGTSSFVLEGTGSMGHLAGEGSLTVPTTTLDALVEQGKVLPPDCVKMDIEGAELLALRGATDTFRRFHPVLFLATHGREVENGCLQLLESWGYEWRAIQRKSESDLGEFVASFRDEESGSRERSPKRSA